MIEIFGASDDLIEVRGDIYDEIDCYQSKPEWIPFELSNGVKGRIAYAIDGTGQWRVEVDTPDLAPTVLVRATDEDDDYSDKLTVHGDIEWMKCHGQTLYAKGREPKP